MRILILSANTGEGHNSTAKAVTEVLEQQGVTCDLRDTLAFLSPKFSQFICTWHNRIYLHSPKLFDAGYGSLERHGYDPDKTSPVYELLTVGAGNLRKVLVAGDYDGVICTHTFSAMMLTEVRRVWGLRIPAVFISTDYTCTPTVELSDLDGYVIPAGDLRREFAQAGVREDRLLPYGIPVRQSFYTRTPREEARGSLHLPEKGKVALIMCGSMGCGPIEKVTEDLLKRIPDGVTLVAICGHNEKLQESLSAFRSEKLIVLGYTSGMSDYMDAADLIITKPGGLSTTEAANKHLPMVLINAVGGCESRNFDFFLNNGLATGSSDPEEAVMLALELLTDDSWREQIRTALENGFRENSARLIADWVTEHGMAYRREVQERQKRIICPEDGHPLSRQGEWKMEHNVTAENLIRSFAGESQARMRYTVYAGIAREEGLEWIARIFEETGENEAVHAGAFLEQLQKQGGCGENRDLSAGYPYQVGTTAENLAYAAEGEKNEHDRDYPAFAEMARREGYEDAARLWMQIARVEGVHHNTFRSLYEQMASGTLTEKDTPIKWRCLHCGYTYESTRGCDPCPICGKGAGWQSGELDQRALMPKK